MRLYDFYTGQSQSPDIDYRQLDNPCLVKSKRALDDKLPSRFGISLLPLNKGPSSFFYLLTTRPAQPQLYESYSQLYSQITRLFLTLVSHAPGYAHSNLNNMVISYRSVVHQLLLEEKHDLFPFFLRHIPLKRRIQEFLYIHQGLEKFTSSLEVFFHRLHQQQLSKKEVDHYYTRHFHLLEHHFEDLEQRIWPAISTFETSSPSEDWNKLLGQAKKHILKLQPIELEAKRYG